MAGHVAKLSSSIVWSTKENSSTTKSDINTSINPKREYDIKYQNTLFELKCKHLTIPAVFHNRHKSTFSLDCGQTNLLGGYVDEIQRMKSI